MQAHGTCLAITALAALVGACFQTDPIELGADADSAAETDSPEVAIEPMTCLSAAPDRVQFAESLIGRSAIEQVVVRNCGDQAVRLFEAGLEPGSSASFELVGFTQPVTLAPGASETLNVSYVPTTAGGVEGTIVVAHESGMMRVPVGGTGYAICPAATVAIAEGTQVAPQTVLHLSALASRPAPGDITYTWEVSQPSGSTSVPLPSAHASEVTVEANVAGPYVVRLTATDSRFAVSCAPVEVEVEVRPTVAVHVELLWHSEPEPPPELETPGPWFVVTTTTDTPVAIDPASRDGLIAGVPSPAIAIESPPRQGSVALTDGRLVYTPAEGFTGDDFFWFRNADNPLLGAVRIYVSAIGNTPPKARNDRITTPVEVAFDTVVLVANDLDVDGDRLSVIPLDVPAHGEIVVSNVGPNTAANYVPYAGYAGPDRFRYGVVDERGGYEWATVDILVGDPQPGADLDLHLLDVTQGATYFDPDFDTYWRNPEPAWSSDGAGSVPRLDRDDTNGDGPENINVDALAATSRYCIGVHGWDDFGRGVSRATVRIYIDGDLAFEANERIEHDDLWEVACIDGQTRIVETLVDEAGAHRITHDYPRPD